MKYLATGGAGFIASHLVDKLIKENNEVVVIDNLSTGKKENLNSKARFYKTDIQDLAIKEIFKKEKPKIVFHYAAQIDIRKSVENPVESAKTNILGTLNILENCKKFGVKKIVFASTGGAIYGKADIIPTPEKYPAKPISPYGIEKLTAEHYLYFYKKEYELNYLVLRYGNVYGPRQNSKGEAGVIAIFCDKMLTEEQPIINGTGEQTRDFIFVEDAVNAALLGVKKRISGIFNIATAKETNINTVFEKLKGLFNLNFQKVYGPAQKGEQQRSCLDFKKAKKEFGFYPQYDLATGLKKTANWFLYGE